LAGGERAPDLGRFLGTAGLGGGGYLQGDDTRKKDVQKKKKVPRGRLGEGPTPVLRGKIETIGKKPFAESPTFKPSLPGEAVDKLTRYGGGGEN